MHGCPNPGHCSGAAAANPTSCPGAGAAPCSIENPTIVRNTFNTIAEDDHEDDIDEQEEYQEWLEMQGIDDYWDEVTARAYEAMDQFRDAESELEELRAAEQGELGSLTSEFEEFLEDAGAKKKVVKLMSGHGPVVKDLSTTECDDAEVVQILNAHAGPQVSRPLSGHKGADLPSDYHERSEQEKIDTFKNQDFARRFEARQDQLIQEQTARAHAAIAGRTSFKTLSGPKDSNPEAIRDLHF